MKLHAALVLAGLTCVATGCATDEPATATANHTEETFASLLDDNDYVFRDVVAMGDHLYFARGPRGVQVRTADDFETVEQLWFTRGTEVLTDAEVDVRGEDGDLRIMADGLQANGEQLVVWGIRDDSPLDPFGGVPWQPKKLVIQSIVDHQLTWRLSLELPRASSIPSLEVVVAHGELAIAFGGDDSEELIVVDEPAEGDDILAPIDELEGARSRPLPVYPQGLRASEDGYLLAAGPKGLLGIGRDGAVTTICADDALDYVVDAAPKGDLVFVADHSQALHVVSLTTGEVIETVEVPDWTNGVVEHDGVIYVGTSRGLFATPDVWSPVDDTPADADSRD